MFQSPASTCSPEINSFSSRERCLLNDRLMKTRMKYFFIFPASGKPPNSYRMTKIRECPSRQIDSEGKRLCLRPLEATACELACSIPFALVADFYIPLKCHFIRMITQMYSYYSGHISVQVSLGSWDEWWLLYKPLLASSFSWPPVSIALLAPSRSVMGTAPTIQKKPAKTDGKRL